MERTLILIKPDAMQRGLAGEILARFERMGLKIVGIKMLQPDREHYYHHYETISKLISRTSQEVFDVNSEFMMKSPVIAIVLEGIEVVATVRKMVGATEPKSAAPGTIRGDYSHISYDHSNAHGVTLPNLLHASGDPDEAAQEIEHWFKPDELFDYRTSHEEHTQPRKR